MSTTDTNLARMIARLRTYRSGNHTRYQYNERTHRYGYQHLPGKKVFTDEQIMEVFGIDKERFDFLNEWYRTQVSPRLLTPEEWKKRYFKFWDKHHRWHTSTDEKNWSKTGLLSPRAYFSSDARGAWMQHYCFLREGKLRKYPEMVFTIPNLTIRRNVITRLGGPDALVESLVKQGKAEQVQQDDFGILWMLNFRDGADSHMRYVEVINSSKNEDGEYDHYFLRVPLNITTARRGVAWTFDKPVKGFKFAAQS